MQSLLGNTTRKPDIVFHYSGKIDITSHVAKSLNLQHGDVIDIMLTDGEYYLYIRHRAPAVGRHQGMVFRTNNKGNHFRAWSKMLCNAILKECHTTGKAKLYTGEPLQDNQYGIMLPIITKMIL